jgi:hypothetical protein
LLLWQVIGVALEGLFSNYLPQLKQETRSVPSIPTSMKALRSLDE